MQFGRCYEEFEVGDIYKHWPGRTITEYDDTLFSMLTMNHNPLHIDANYAEDTQHGQRLVVGPLIFSIALGMSVPDVSGKAIANLEFEYVRHLAPTFHGDTIYAETKVLDKQFSRSKPDRGIITVETIAYNQRGENVLSFKRRVMVPTREHDEARQRVFQEKMEQARKDSGGTKQ
ncbi:MAG TPA: MaoC family dehydratase [Ktedonobacteraceae bacterium]|nr:MaoC family dehydratase [Ktedonobacteraceae bacterium]